MNINNSKIAIVGLGYVGLPLAVAFARKYKVIGFDINQRRVDELNSGNDNTLEVTSELLRSVLNSDSSKFEGLTLTTDSIELIKCNIFIVTVPTPIDKYNRPDLSPMIKASQIIGKCLNKSDIVIYESTVYPGVTEDEMVPVLEKISGLKYNVDFYCGYSPERINPGDKEYTVTKIVKITSGSTPVIAKFVDELYKSVITAGTYLAPSIKVAEAAKVIENTQRDINIAFVNELSKVFNLMGIDTNDVLNAAGTKWNFIKFKPGLVGGHCIGVDPYYLAQKAQEVGYHPEILLAGRRLNDSMGKYVATEVIKLMIKKGLKVINANVLILGFTFKENCPDIRNSKVIDIYNELQYFDINVSVYDPLVNMHEVNKDFKNLKIIDKLENNLSDFSAVILAVAHNEFKSLDLKSSKKLVVYDVKGFLDINKIDGRL